MVDSIISFKNSQVFTFYENFSTHSIIEQYLNFSESLMFRIYASIYLMAINVKYRKILVLLRYNLAFS